MSHRLMIRRLKFLNPFEPETLMTIQRVIYNHTDFTIECCLTSYLAEFKRLPKKLKVRIHCNMPTLVLRAG